MTPDDYKIWLSRYYRMPWRKMKLTSNGYVGFNKHIVYSTLIYTFAFEFYHRLYEHKSRTNIMSWLANLGND